MASRADQLLPNFAFWVRPAPAGQFENRGSRPCRSLMPVRLGHVDLVTARQEFGALNLFCEERAQKKIGMIKMATMLTTLIIGLMAGPAVSLYGAPTVSLVTDAACANEP